ncbi:hypothetical protein AB0300_05610 [Microbacterium sp. NPDC078814]|jgi:hypothetical protein|uniref:hypothetical protein n=1 Tax=Microbacterium sp. NPDC078814 TaxID=3154767 RepID=UPI00344F6650
MNQSRINWSTLDESTFNALVESLLVREFTSDGQVAMAIDGRGGDGGIDVDVRSRRTDELLRIYQLKHFPEGFSGGFVNRRTQIKRSLLEALKHNPPAWTLVVPRNVTAKERQAVRAMRKGYDVRVSFLGPAEMDGLLAKHPDIEERFTMDRSLELLRAVHREEAALERPGDLRSEVARMSDRLHGRSEYWGTSFAMEPDGSYLETYFPKRADAPDREPLGANFTLQFTPDDGHLKARWESAMKFGAIEPVVLPTHVIRHFEKTGPDWFREVLDDVEVHFGPAGEAHEPRSIRVEARDASGRILAAVRGRTTALAHGYGGYTFDAKLEGGITQRWTLPLDRNESGAITFSADFLGFRAREIRRALRFIEETHQAPIIALTFDGMPPILLNFDAPEAAGRDDTFTSFINDVCTLEDYFEVDLRLPSNIDSTDLIWARIMRRLVEGSATAHPRNGTFGGILDGTSDPGIEGLLAGDRAAVIRQSGFGIEFFGELLEIDGLAYYTHHALVDDAESLRQAFVDDTAEGKTITVRPADGLPWVIYSPTHIERAGHTTVLAQPWGIPGLPEHPGFARLPNHVRSQESAGPQTP